jgi:hypothetical protein
VNRPIRALLVTAAALGSTLALATPSYAATAPALPTVTVTQTDDGVAVGAGSPGQPIGGVRVGTSGACAGISYQMPQCVDTTLVTDAISIQTP